MTTMEKIDDSVVDNVGEWESGKLGLDHNTAELAPPLEGALDDGVGLKAISIRLEKQLIDDFKALAQINGIGYQPLMRQALARFAEGEKKRYRNSVIAERERAMKEDEAAEGKLAELEAQQGEAQSREGESSHAA